MISEALRGIDKIQSVKVGDFEVVKYEILKNEIIFYVKNEEEKVIPISATIKHLEDCKIGPEKSTFVQRGKFIKKGKSLYEKQPDLIITINFIKGE